MSWNYRVVYHGPKIVKIGDEETITEEWYGIHEVYYDKDGEPEMYAIDPVIHGSNTDELKDVVECLGNCLVKLSLNVKIFEEEEWEKKKKI